MDRPLIIPVMISAALHLGVLFGLRWPHERIFVETSKPPVPLQPEFVQLLDPPDPVASADSPESTKGKTDPVPVSPEPPPPARDPGSFTIPVTAPVPNVVIDKPTVAHLPGAPGGDGSEGEFAHGGVISSKYLDNSPRTRLQIAPIYPAEAKARGLTGDVVVEFIVNESGAVEAPRVVQSTDRIFDEAALRAVARWRFEAGRRAGQVVRFRMAVPIVFRLNED